MSSLAGRGAVITGASSGIGEACALAFAREGMMVALLARREDRLAELAGRITKTGSRAIALPTDVTDEAGVEAAVDRAVAALGRLDVLICNAGIGYIAALDETPAAVMRRLFDVNFMGTFHAARAAVPILRRQGSGHILVVSSILGKRGMQYSSGYAATKAAQIALAESLRGELRRTGVSVSVVLPVSTKTEFLDTIARDYGRQVRSYGPRQSADRVAQQIVRTLRRPRGEVYPYAPARLLPVINALSPSLCDWVLRAFGRKRA